MQKWKIYQYDRCDTCRKALKFLDANGIAYDALDVTVTPPSLAELRTMAAAVGDYRKLFNTSGVVYREEKIGEKLKSLSEADALKLLASNGRLVKRPFALWNGGGTVGFRETQWKAAVKSIS